MEPVLRLTARVIPVAASGEVLLLQDQDPAHPGHTRWGTIGGAVDPGESLVEAALRELHEETGIVAGPADLIGPVHQDRYEFSYGGRAYLGDSTFFALALERDTEITFAHLEAAEVGNILAAQWWSPHELAVNGPLVTPDLCDVMIRAVQAVRTARDHHPGPARVRDVRDVRGGDQ